MAPTSRARRMLALDSRDLSRGALQPLALHVSIVTASPIPRDCSEEEGGEPGGGGGGGAGTPDPVSYTHLRAHETGAYL
eukprot:484437-Pyramimonas_sp.AAC.1